MIVDITDSVLLTDEALSLYEHECAILVANQQGGDLANGLVTVLNQELNGVRGYRGLLIQPGLLDLYRSNNPSQRAKLIQNWYD